MGVSWTPRMDQRLLLVVLSTIKLDAGAVAAKLFEQYGSEGGEQPTKKAITQHIGKLKRSLGISGSPNSIIKSPKQPKESKKPKRPPKKTKLMSPPADDRDDSEMPPPPIIKEEGEALQTPPPSHGSRSPTFGRSALGSPGKNKRKSGSMSDEDDDSADGDNASVKSEGSGEYRRQANGVPSSPVRFMQPRRAKSQRPAMIVDETTEDEDEDEGLGEGEVVDEGEVEVEERSKVPGPRILDEIVVARPEIVV